MKKYMTAFLFATALTAGAMTFNSDVSAQAQPAATVGIQVATVTEALAMTDDAKVTLTGKIVAAVAGDDDTYTFRDASGETTVEIDDDYATVVADAMANDKEVTMMGEVEIDDGRTEIEVDAIMVK